MIKSALDHIPLIADLLAPFLTPLIAVFCYILLVSFLITLTRSARRQLAVRGTELLARLPHGSPDYLKLQNILENVLNGTVLWWLAFRLPVAMLTRPKPQSKISQDLALCFLLFLICNAAVNPMAALLIVAELALYFLIRLPRHILLLGLGRTPSLHETAVPSGFSLDRFFQNIPSPALHV